MNKYFTLLLALIIINFAFTFAGNPNQIHQAPPNRRSVEKGEARNKRSPYNCGRSSFGSAFAVGGEYSEAGQWPWLAPLFKKEGDQFFCGSSIISENFLLTAAHCIQNKVKEGEEPTLKTADEIYASLGRYNLKNKAETSARKADIETIYIHPDWNNREVRFDGDAALLKTVITIIFTNYIKPVCLPTEDAKVFNVNGYVAGYGLSEDTIRHETRPKHVRIKSVTHETCLFGDPFSAFISSPRMFCAGEKGKNPCQGDSGSGWYVNVDNAYQIIGIVSSAARAECEANHYVIFTSVPKFLEWIKENVNSRTSTCQRTATCTIENDHDGPKCNVSPVQLGSEKFCKITFEDDPNPTVDKLNFIGSSMEFVPDVSSAITKFKNLNKFDAGWVGIKEISRSDMRPMKDFTWVSFWGNQIAQVPSDTFADLTKMDKLILGSNRLTKIHADTFSTNVKLRELWLQNNEIEVLPRGIFRNNPELSLIYANNNKLTTIKIDFLLLPKFHYITLTDNECIDENCDASTYCGKNSKEAMQQYILLKC